MKQNKHHIGLTDAQVLESRKLYGNNELTEPQKTSQWKLLIEKFTDPLIIILLSAMVLSFIVSIYQYTTGEESASVFLEPLGILIAVALAIGVSFLFEQSANKKFEILNKEEEKQPIKVIRNGNFSTISQKDIVVGDIVLLDVGDEIPADGILLESVSLYVNESSLTGESSTRKTINSNEFNKDATYPSDRVLRGTTVIDGHGTMKVTMVGDRTEYGKVYKGSRIDKNIKTPLNIQLEKLSKIITITSYVIAALILIGRAIIFFSSNNHENEELLEIGKYILNTLMIAITIIVVAVPEGLPMSVSLSLALSMRRMLSTNNLVRKMHACETMGAATVICTDKTGTLTQNQMRISDTSFIALGEKQDKKGGDIWSLIVQSIAANSTANLDLSEKRIRTLGNPTESALLLWLRDNGIDYRIERENSEIIEQSAFSTEKKYMATIVKSNIEEKDLLLLKGAPEIILSMCNEYQDEITTHKLTEEKRKEIDNKFQEYQNRAMRTLGFAYKYIDKGTHCFDEAGRIRINELTYLGVVGILDPIRAEVPEAIKSCLNAGIKIKIVTGDTPRTAKEIGRQIGLWTTEDNDEENHITGTDFAALSNEKALEIVDKIKIMSRARPMDKSRLVDLLQQRNEVVAVTGDGMNDGPALKAAQVGLSMGDGTSAAKQASEITILDNSFKSINQAVLWGRSLYRNIQRFLLFQLTINVAACIVVVLGSFVGAESPLTVTQMLWVNLIMDTFAAIALASLPPENRVMKDKPRDTNANIISKGMLFRIVSVGCLFVSVLMAFLRILKYNDVQSLQELFNGNISFINVEGIKSELTDYELSLFFTTFVLFQFWNMFNAKAYKTERSAFKSILQCKSFLLIALVIFIGQILIVNIGGQMFNVVPLNISDWLFITFATAITLLIGEIVRFIEYITKNVKDIKND